MPPNRNESARTKASGRRKTKADGNRGNQPQDTGRYSHAYSASLIIVSLNLKHSEYTIACAALITASSAESGWNAKVGLKVCGFFVFFISFLFAFYHFRVTCGLTRESRFCLASARLIHANTTCKWRATNGAWLDCTFSMAKVTV